MITVRTFDYAMRVMDTAEPVPDEETALVVARTLVDDAFSSDAALVQGWRKGVTVAFYVDGELVWHPPASAFR
jgi:hypothetical protein